MLQSLDMSLNKPFKTKIGNLWILWMVEGKAESELTAKSNFKQPSLPTVVSWVKTAWDEIPAEMVQKSFQKCSISNNLDDIEVD